MAAWGDPTILDSIRAQAGEWESESGATLSYAEPGDPDGADILIFPGELLGGLVDEGKLAVLPESVVRPSNGLPLGDADASEGGEETDPLAFDDVLPVYRTEVSKYGDDRYGLPLGGSALVLVYRRDAMADPAIVEAAESAGIAA